MVPIVEPELLMDGEHSINVCNDVTSMILEETFYQLANNNVDVEGIVLKPNMILNGSESSAKNNPSRSCKTYFKLS